MTEKLRKPKTQIFAENLRFSQIHPFSWKFEHLEGAGNRRRFSQKTAGTFRLGGPSPLARPYFSEERHLRTVVLVADHMLDARLDSCDVCHVRARFD